LADILTLFEVKLGEDQITNAHLAVIFDENCTYSCAVTPLNVPQDDENEENFSYDRSQTCGFPTALVGDQSKCKNNRRVKHKDQTAFAWVAEIPGDLHAKEHLCKAAYKAQARGGFYHLVNNILKRKKLMNEAFRKKNFKSKTLNTLKRQNEMRQ